MNILKHSWIIVIFISSTLFCKTIPSVELFAKTPSGSLVKLRLLFQHGIQIESIQLPKSFVKHNTNSNWINFKDLNTNGKLWALHVIFPKDIWNSDGVVHVVRWPELESVWLISSLFIGNGQKHDELQQLNINNSEKLSVGDKWKIPKKLLTKELGGDYAITNHFYTQPEDNLDDYDRTMAFRSLLIFDHDSNGDMQYAYYRLRKNEALYSNVVMRYTDQIDPKGVNDLALEIAHLSGIVDVRKIRPGQLVKIPIKALASPFQPEGTSAFTEERKIRSEAKRTHRIIAGECLNGVHIVLDAGHGGIDKGAVANGVWESDYVYDIAMRVRRILEQSTEATVSCTIRYPSFGFNPRNLIDTPSSDAEILTTPPFINDGESPNNVSVHLRWILANHLFSKANSIISDYKKTLFLSFHADSLHPSARGTMIYVPGAIGVPSSFKVPYMKSVKVNELTNIRKVILTDKDRLQSEVRSHMFAESILKSLKEEGIPTHENRPIRNIVLRDGKSFIPAVIRYSIAATKVLLEVLNLTNREDADSLKNFAFREHYAQAIVKGIKAFYKK